MNIEIKPYLQHALQFNSEEIKMQNELLDKVPSKIIDVHSHIGLPNDAVGLDPGLLANLITVYPYFSYENHMKTRAKLWGENKNLKQVVFTFPFRGIDIRRGNEYIQEIVIQDKSFIPFLTGDPNDIDYTIGELDTHRWKGIKMYPEQLKPPAERIVDFFPLPILEKIDDLRLPLILHLPTNLMKDATELIRLAQNFSHISFIIAHFGMVRWDLDTIQKTLTDTGHFDNIFYETSWYTDKDILSKGLEILGPERILYGSDQPLNLVRAMFIQHPVLGERVLTDYPYHWVNLQEQAQYRKITEFDPSRFPNIHFQSLSAVVNAVETVFGTENLKAKERIFYENAVKILKV